MNNFFLISMVLLMTALGALGGFCIKISSASEHILSIIKSRYLYMGISLYIIGAVFNIWVLKYLPYSVVLPLTSITYVWSMLLSVVKLHEKFTVFKLIGIISIISGAFIISFYQ